MQRDTRRAAGPAAAAASSWAAAARAAVWVWSVPRVQASSPRPTLVYCAPRAAIALLRRRSTQKFADGRPCVVTIIPCGARRLKLSLSAMFSSLASSNVSLDLFSFYVFVTERGGETPRRGPRLGCRTAMQARTLMKDAVQTIVVGIVPPVPIHLPARASRRLGLVQQSSCASLPF